MLSLFCIAFLCFVFRLYAFVEAAALRSIILRYARAPIATRLFCFGDIAFSEYLFVPFPLSLCMEITSYVLSFRMVFFYLVTKDWIFYISVCENSINSININAACGYGLRLLKVPNRSARCSFLTLIYSRLKPPSLRHERKEAKGWYHASVSLGNCQARLYIVSSSHDYGRPRVSVRRFAP